MKISLEWLREYADLDVPPGTLVRALVDTGTEVDRVDRGPEGVIVVRVTGLEPVPGTTLQFADIDAGAAGSGPTRLITGAPNLAVGDLVPWAPPGTWLPGWDQPLGTRRFFDQYDSPGMLCSAVELGIGDDAAGIHVLQRGVPGDPLHEALTLDVILDVEATTNRPDSMCHLGIARELAAALKEDLRPPASGVAEALRAPAGVDQRLTVRIEEPAGCHRFTAMVIEGLTVGPSPEWLQRRLRAVGQNPVNNVVDTTNYVMMELGQPLHAFDWDRFVSLSGTPEDGADLVVRRGRPGESIACLDGVTRPLTPDDLTVCAGAVAASIAGIIGGAGTAVDGSTRTVLLEAASWDGRTIRETSRRVGRRTDASALFEKDLSDELPPVALDRAAALIAELGHGQVLHGVVDVDGSRLPPIPPVEISVGTISRRLGCPVEAGEASAALARLGFAVRARGDCLRVAPPYFRRDVSIPEDIVEEVGRSIGYDRVPSTLPGRRMPVGALAPPTPLDEWVRDVCAGSGFDEAITYSFTSVALVRRIQGGGGDRPPIPLQNPLSDEWSVLRTSLLPGLCQALARNIHHSSGDIALFEVGRVYWEGARDGLAPGSTADGADAALVPLPAEPLMLALAANAPRDDSPGSANLLRHLQSVIEWIGRDIGGAGITVVPARVPGFHPTRSARLQCQGRDLGVAGELSPAVTGDFDVHDRVVVAEVNLDALAPMQPRVARYRTPPRFPALVQDLAVVVDVDVPAAGALAAIREAGTSLLEDVELYDEFRGERVGPGRKGWTFRFTFRAPGHTLTGAEAQAAQDAICAALQERCGAVIRT